MKTKIIKSFYYITTVLISLFYLIGTFMYFTGHENIVNSFSSLNFPYWLIRPLGVAKFLGIVALWLPIIPKWLREWAYAGIFFNALLAFGANIAVGKTDFSAVLIMLLVIASRYFLEQYTSSSIHTEIQKAK